MNLLLRTLAHLICSMFRSKLGVLDTSVVRFRVLPNDLDINLHMNNGRYLSLMDIGRIDLMIRCGIARAALKNRWRPMLASEMIRFRKGLQPFEKYALHSRLIGWDERYTYMEHKFVRDGRVIAAALVKGSLVGADGPVATATVIAALGTALPSPVLPPYVLVWQQAEEQMKEAAF